MNMVRMIGIVSVAALVTILVGALIGEWLPPSEGLVLHFPSNN